MENSKRAIFGKIGHYLAALVIFMKGIDKIDTPGKTGIAILFLAFSLFIVLGATFHHKAEKLLRHFDLYVFILESVVIATVGYLYMKDGKTFLPYFCFAASAMYLVAAIIYLIKLKKHSQHATH